MNDREAARLSAKVAFGARQRVRDELREKCVGKHDVILNAGNDNAVIVSRSGFINVVEMPFGVGLDKSDIAEKYVKANEELSEATRALMEALR